MYLFQKLIIFGIQLIDSNLTLGGFISVNMMKTQNVVENVNRVKIFKNNKLLIRDGLYKTDILDLSLDIAPLYLMAEIVNSTNTQLPTIQKISFFHIKDKQFNQNTNANI
jgi:hypothetical protein